MSWRSETSFFRRQAANAKPRQGTSDLAATIHDAAVSIFHERDVEGDEQSERWFELLDGLELDDQVAAKHKVGATFSAQNFLYFTVSGA